MKNKFNFYLVLVFVFFALFYFLLSIVPHINFQTNAFDLGIFNQSLYQYSHFEIGPNTVRGVSTLFADHFEGIMFLFAPFYWLFGSYTLLVVQIGFVLFAALGVYLLVKNESKNDETVALIATAAFLSFFGIITALAFDYHNNVIGAMFIPWLLYFLSCKKFHYYYFALALFLITKENMALISIFLGISMFFFYDRDVKKHGVFTILISVLYFFLSLQIIKYLNGSYDHWPYTVLGDSPLEAIKFIAFHPFKTLSLFFDDHAKMKMWILLLFSGGIFAIFRPRYSILLIPILAQKFFSDEPAFWGYTFHYSVEFAPIIVIGAAIFISSFKAPKYRFVLISSLLFLNLAILTQIKFYNGDDIFRIFDLSYYQLAERAELNNAIMAIESANSVTAQNTIVPHLKNNEIYLFPDHVGKSEYVILDLNNDNIWPIASKEDLLSSVRDLEEGDDYSKVYESNDVYIFELVD